MLQATLLLVDNGALKGWRVYQGHVEKQHLHIDAQQGIQTNQTRHNMSAHLSVIKLVELT